MRVQAMKLNWRKMHPPVTPAPFLALLKDGRISVAAYSPASRDYSFAIAQCEVNRGGADEEVWFENDAIETGEIEAWIPIDNELTE